LAKILAMLAGGTFNVFSGAVEVHLDEKHPVGKMAKRRLAVNAFVLRTMRTEEAPALHLGC